MQESLKFGVEGNEKSVSVGGCLWAGPPWEQEVLPTIADQALYRVKHAGGSGFLLEAAPEAQVEDCRRWQLRSVGADRTRQ